VGWINPFLGGVMVALIRKHWGNVVTAALGLLTALLIFPLAVQSMHWLQDWYDASNPVVQARLLKAEHVEPDALRLQFVVTRKRDCDFVRLLGMTGNGPSDMQIATTLRREDGADPISYPAGVTTVSRTWLLAPVYGPHLMLWGYYACDDRLVRTKMIDEVVK
jgi:hypothetical protein